MDIYKKLTFEERDELSIPEMKAILQQAVLIKEEESNDRILRNIKSNAMGILSIAGKRGLYELVPELYQLVDHWDPYLRAPAVSNLGCWLKVPEFKERVYEIFINDDSDDVKFSALQSWRTYHRGTANKLVIEQLYKILINDNYDISVREVALMGIFEVIGVWPESFDPYTSDLIMQCNTPAEFNSKVEWKEVTELLKKYAPDALKNYPIQWTKDDYEKAKNIAKESALILLAKGADIPFISKVTNLSTEEIEGLKQRE